MYISRTALVWIVNPLVRHFGLHENNHPTRSGAYYDHLGEALFDPRGMNVRIYVELQMTLLHIKYIQALCHAVAEKKIFLCISITNKI